MLNTHNSDCSKGYTESTSISQIPRHPRPYKNHHNPPAASAQPPGLSLGLEQGEDVSLTDGTLDVPHDETVLVIQELHSDLGNLTPGSSPSHHFHHNSQLHLGVHPALINDTLVKLDVW
jgi:hypothetical protein